MSFRQHEDVLTSSLTAVASLVDSVAPFQDQVSVAVIVSVMEENFMSRVVIEAALSALLSVFNGRVSAKCAEANRKSITSPVSVKIILECVRNHVTSEVAAERGCQLVTLLCSRFKFVHKEFLEFGACHLILDAFKVHKRSLSVLHEAGSTALVVCQQSAAAVSALCDLGLISTLAVLLRNFATKEGLVVGTCEVVLVMVQQQGAKWSSLSGGGGGGGGGGSSHNAQAFLVAGFSLVIVEILQMYAAAGGGEGSSSSQRRESFSEETGEGAGAPGTSLPQPQGKSDSLSHSRQKILEYAIGIVGHLASMDAQLCQELEAAGVCECVLLLLIKSSAGEQGDRVLQATLRTVSQLARQADTRRHLVDIEVLDYIDQAVSTHRRGGVDCVSLLKVVKKTKAVLTGQSFLQRNIGVSF